MLIPWLPDETEQDVVVTLPLLPLAKLRWTFLSQPRYFMRRSVSSVDVVSGKH
uniref:Uncharacterized protein n=1 Tax=viral metagenome TaxID=1070528 RepID=A0A6C0HYT3_9ZZZZ